MKISALFLAAVISQFSLPPVFASDFGLQQNPVQVEVPPPAGPSAAPLISEYAEYYSALDVFSNKAYAAPQDSAEYYEAHASGVYLRGRVEKLAARIRRIAGAEREVCSMVLRGRNSVFKELVESMPRAICRGVVSRKDKTRAAQSVVSPKITDELDAVFNFSAAGKGQKENEPIKAGYCQINYVKNGVPFLVQYDGFLKKGEVIITFDDGPGAMTEEVSASMKAGNAPSLFFVLGRNLGAGGKKHIKAAAADGHQVGVHGFYHATENDKPFTAYSTEKIISQLGGVAGTITDATGAAPAFFRPPYGIIAPDALRAITADLNLVPVGWTIDTLDWSTKDPDELYAKTISMIQRRGKGIVLMHDIHAQSRTAAAKLVTWLAENGYKVVSPDRLARAYKGK